MLTQPMTSVLRTTLTRAKATAKAVVVVFVLFALSVNLYAQDAPETTFTVRIENISGEGTEQFADVGIFSIPVDATEARAAQPGEAFEFVVRAEEGDHLSFVTMYGESNDTFFATVESGIPLFDEEGNPVNGDVTDLVNLWDAGTEANEPLGTGPNQAPRQPASDSGEAQGGTVTKVAPSQEFASVSDLMTVTLSAVEFDEVLVRIENHSDAAPVPTGFSPGVYVIHSAEQPSPFFTAEAPDRGEGLERIAEDGNPEALGAALAGSAAMDVGVSPGIYVIHTVDQFAPFFIGGDPDRGQGLERLAEDGDPTMLSGTFLEMGLKNIGVFNMAVGTEFIAPLMSGQAFEFTFTASPGDRLSAAMMFGQSNDLFFATDPNGVPLFTPDGAPVNGVITGAFRLWDAGTELNQEPFVGSDQAPRQLAPDTGAVEGIDILPIALVDDGFAYPSVLSSIRVTVTPAGAAG